MVLNSTNGQIIAKITASEDFEGWIGKQIVLNDDQKISFSGKVTGGIRARAPKVKKSAPATDVAPKPAPVTIVEDDSQDVPF